MAKDMGPFRDSQASYWLSGPRTDVPIEHLPPLIGSDSKDESVFALLNLSFQFQYYSLHTNTNKNVKKMSS
jgi:hypothetical protein